MKKVISLIFVVMLVGLFALMSVGCGEEAVDNQGSGNIDVVSTENNNLGDYLVEIKSCRLAKDYADADVVIVKYKFTNNSKKPAAFYLAFSDKVYQDGISLNESYVLDDSAEYNADNQTKDIKSGKSIDVEAAYELNDTKTDIEVELKELISFNNNVITKKFKISGLN